jgi:hypothetical protein
MNGLQVKYTELLSLRVEQPFYINSYCKKYNAIPEPDFILMPTYECIDTMKRLDLICRNTDENAGLTVFSSVHGKNMGGDNLLRFLPLNGDKLSFWMIIKNPALINFNILPVAVDNSKLFYFSNQVTDLGALRNNLHLTIASAGVNEINDTVIRKNAGYTYHHGAIVAPGTAVVKHVLTGIEMKASSIINQIGSADIYFDLSDLPQGNCKLFINLVETDAFYYLGKNVPQQVFGVIEFSLANTLNANYRIVEADRSLLPARPFYTVHFINRPTLWRYIVELHTNSPLYLEMNALSAPDKTDFINRLNILSNDAAITFSQTAASPDGTSFEFVSNSAVALQEKYISSSSVTKDTLSLTLKKYIGTPAKEAAVKTDLQCPSTGSINAINNPVIYSDIFLTI